MKRTASEGGVKVKRGTCKYTQRGKKKYTDECKRL